MHNRRTALWIGGAVLCGFFCTSEVCWGGLAEKNVLVLYNADDGPAGAGFQIAQHYGQVHPGVHVVGISGINSYYNGVDTQPISATNYLAAGGLRDQVLSAIGGITDSIDVIVSTKGMPLKIDAGANPGGAFKWRRYSSLESELTRIDSVNTAYEMGEQSFLIGLPTYDTALASNPYYNKNVPFVRQGSDPTNGDIRLAARLDGYSVETVNSAIDRAQKAYVVPLPYGPMVVADDDPTAGVDQMTSAGLGPGPGLQSVLDAWQQTAEQKLSQNLNQPGYHFPVPFDQYDGTDAAVTTAPGPVIGYVSHGTHDGSGGLDSQYIPNQLQFQLANGAVFLSHESYNATSFDPSYAQAQGLIAQWLEKGGTAGLGHVAEPYNGPDNVTNEDLFYQMLLPPADGAPGATGLTFVEAAWNATRQLSYVNTVVGDPLMRIKIWIPGDANLDGGIGFADLNAWRSGQFLATPHWNEGDFNGDGSVGFVDFGIWSKAGSYAIGGGSGAGAAGSATAVPEPSGLMLLSITTIGWGLLLRRGAHSSRQPV